MKRIYISDMVHEQLKREAKREGRTLQWVVEQKLTGNVFAELPPSPKNTNVKTLEDGTIPMVPIPQTPKEWKNHQDKVNDLINKPLPEPVIPNPLPDAMDILATQGELPCCENEFKPCKHWVWDINTGEGHINSLSGRFKEAE